MRRDLTLAGLLWALMTAATLAATKWIVEPLIFPTPGAHEAEVIDGAFMTLTYMAAPVFGLVTAVLIVAVLRFRSKGGQGGDGPPLLGEGVVPRTWFAVTTALAVLMIIYPGMTGLFELRNHPDPEMEINVTGQMWSWTVEYPASGVKISAAQEIVFPMGKTVQVNVRSKDVLHSFWIPAFRQKIDAVPGKTTVVFVTPDRVGDTSDVAYRLQCAELCGVGHSLMASPVRVVAQADFDAWVTGQRQRAEAK